MSELHSERVCDSCEVSKKSFFHNNNLSEHISLSSREKSLVVNCVSNRSLISVVRCDNLRGRERKFSCYVSNKSSTSRYDLESHIRVHSGEDPFVARCARKGSLIELTYASISQYTVESDLSRANSVRKLRPPHCPKKTSQFRQWRTTFFV